MVILDCHHNFISLCFPIFSDFIQRLYIVLSSEKAIDIIETIVRTIFKNPEKIDIFLPRMKVVCMDREIYKEKSANLLLTNQKSLVIYISILVYLVQYTNSYNNNYFYRVALRFILDDVNALSLMTLII